MPLAHKPFHEAALVLFAAGCPPTVVAKKFGAVATYRTVWRWYNRWAELKGIPRENRYRARKVEEAKHVYEGDLERARLVAVLRKRARGEFDDESLDELIETSDIIND